MNNSIFKLIFVSIFAVVLFGNFTFSTHAQTASQQDILNYINASSSNTTYAPATPEQQQFIENFFKTGNGNYEYLNEEDEFYMTLKPGQSVDNYLQAIQTENARRAALGQTNFLPNPLTSQSTTQVPENNGVIRPPLTGPAPVTTPTQPTPSRTLNSLNSETVQGTSIFEQIAPANGFGSQPLSILLNQIFYVGLAVAVVLAIVMIVRGGIQYMTIDAAASKDSGKKMVQAALGGLTLAFAGILILNTINPNITNLNIALQALRLGQFGGNDAPPITSGTRADGTPIPAGDYGSWNESSAESWINSLQGGTRSTDGRLVVSVYSATGDAITDSNTAEMRGNANNLLREGSVALSPDLIAQHRPALGSEIFINGTSIGFYEDTTAASYNGVPFRNTIDIYDQNKSLGSSNILNNVPAGQWNITFGAPRPQISNP